MARETKAERAVREAAEQAARVEVARATYTNRMMSVLERAVNMNFELTVKDGEFRVEDRDERRRNPYLVSPVWDEMADVTLCELEMSVEFKEDEAREEERRFVARAAALNKLSKEERELLGL